MSYHVFDIFWKAIGLEERKLREQQLRALGYVN